MAPSVKNCEHCGGARSTLVGGLCPRCVLQAGLESLRAATDGKEMAPGYRLLEKIGEGGAGEVFLAEQLVPVHREVALKRLKPGLESADWIRRFDLEREALSQLQHPNIANIFDAGVCADGRPFYSMELVDGLPLTHFCERGKLDLEARLRLFATVCAAVQHAHQKGVLHGDLKPSNILVAVDEAGIPVPKLIDFGVARAAWRQRRGEGSSVRFGTPGYASPEHVGGSRPPDAWSDVYSLGMALRELLELSELLLRGEAGWIVKRATAAVPEERYESANALALDIKKFLACRPLSAGPVRWTYRARKFVWRQRRRLLLVSMIVALLGGGSFALVWQSARTRQAEASLRAAHAAGALDVLRRQAADRIRMGALARNAGRYDEAEQHLLAAREMAAQLGAGDEPRRRQIEHSLAQVYLTARRHREAERVLKRLVALPTLGPSDYDEFEPLLDLTRLYIESRRFDDAEVSAQQALTVTQKYFHRRHPLFLKALHNVGRVHTEQRRYLEAHEAFTETVAGFRHHFGPDSPETRQAAADLAEVDTVLRDMELLPLK